MTKKLLMTLLALAALAPSLKAWDYEGHRAVNLLALDSLPATFPAFVREPAARERIAYLAGEADRWRNVTDQKNARGLGLSHCSGPDHYFDLEDIAHYDLTPETLSPFRFVFAGQIAIARAAHPERFEPIDAAKNADRTRELCGFLPWAVNENFQKLQSGFAALAAFEKAGGTAEEISNAKQNILYVMGVMGHFVGDAGQPLHTTMYHHGWTTNNNPNKYTTSYRFHAWIDGGFFGKTGGVDVKKLSAQVRPAKEIADANSADGIFTEAVNFVVQQNKLVEPLYILDRDGKLSPRGDQGAEGRAFLEAQLLKSSQLLGDIWLTAYRTAPEDTYLIKQLQDRAAAATNALTAPK